MTTVKGDGNCLLYACLGVFSVSQASLKRTKDQLIQFISGSCQSDEFPDGLFLNLPFYCFECFKLLDPEFQELGLESNFAGSTEDNLEHAIEEYPWFDTLTKGILSMGKLKRNATSKDKHDFIIGSLRDIISTKNIGVEALLCELKENNFYLSFGQIAPFFTSFFDSQIIVLSLRENDVYNCLIYPYLKKNKPFPPKSIALVYNGVNHYDFIKIAESAQVIFEASN